MDKENLELRQHNILDLVREFCSKHLDEEYFELSKKLLQKLGRKRNPPFATGQPHIWAAAIIHAVGTINFLFDKSFKPFISSESLNAYFGTNKSTISNKSKLIRDMLKLDYWNNEFSTKRMHDSNPFVRIIIVEDQIPPLGKLRKLR